MSYFRPKSPDSKPLLTLNDFLEDWNELRDRHEGQKAVLKAVFEDRKKCIFHRAGRKGAKTTTNIDIAWRCAWEKPNTVIYYCFPTIALGEDVIWDERRLQTCDCPSDEYMRENYVQWIDNKKHMIFFKNNSFIKLIGTWNERKARGQQPDVFIADEAQDCDGDYLDFMNPNLAAKDGILIMSGTPPRKRNHYHEWEERIRVHPYGECFHFSSYINNKIPHLKTWLDNEKKILVKQNKEDFWIREYLAEDCFSSSDRVLPDPDFVLEEQMVKKIKIWPENHLKPILAVVVLEGYICTIWAILQTKKILHILSCQIEKQLWDKSFIKFFDQIQEKTKCYEDLIGLKDRQMSADMSMFSLNRKHIQDKWRKFIYDPSNSFCDVIPGFSNCRKDLKWQDRGVPLLREKLHDKSILISDSLAGTGIGMEFQNLLVSDKILEVEKKLPVTCTLAMMVNEIFQGDFPTQEKSEQNRYQAFIDAGLPIPSQKKRISKVFSKNW